MKNLCRFVSSILLALFAVLGARGQQYQARDLGTLLGDSYSQAFAINASGQVVGESFNAQGTQVHGFLWNRSHRMQDLGELPGGSPRVFAQAINSSTQVVGQAIDHTGIGHAFLWTQSDGMQDLGSLPGFDSAYAFGINDSGQVV